mgnify:CR=1 FL=1
MSIDLTAMLPADTATMEVLKPGGIEGTGWIVTFGGPAHPRTLAWSNEAARKGLRKAAQIEQSQVNGKKFKAEDRNPDEVRKENVAWVVARIVDWTPITIGGKGYPFSDAAATELLIKPEMGWAFGQMVEFLGADASFTQRSATT